jgi:hypothetical protein
MMQEQTEFTPGCMNLKQRHSHVQARKLDAAPIGSLETRPFEPRKD